MRRHGTLALAAFVLTALADLLVVRAGYRSASMLASLLLYACAAAVATLLVGAMSTTKSVTDYNTRAPASAGRVMRALRALQSAAVFCWMLFRLVLFAGILLPAFLRVGWNYFRSPDIRRSIPYGEKKSFRQTLDVYIPAGAALSEATRKKHPSQSEAKETKEKFPVLVFVGGGAWVVGHRIFCALLGKIFMARGILVIAPDYRQFPQVHASDMLQDIDAAIQWAFDHASEFGGDLDQLYIAGQSAGAHLTSTVLLEHARSEYRENVQSSGMRATSPMAGALGAIAEEEDDEENNEANISAAACRPAAAPMASTAAASRATMFQARDLVCQPWKCSLVAGYAGISGPYHLPALRQHLFERGIEQLSFLTHIVGGEETSMLKDTERDIALQQQSPAIRLRSDTFKEISRHTFVEKLIPPMLLVHGDADNVVPKQSTKSFAKSLRKAGVKDITVKYLKGASHTDPIIEDLLFDESEGAEAGAVTELLALIHRQGCLKKAAAAAMAHTEFEKPVRAGVAGLAERKTRKTRTASMISDGFGFVTDERGRAPSGLTSCVPRLMIRAARAVNPF
jgi:prenylcysteine alpha-carboxyl methylesterase